VYDTDRRGEKSHSLRMNGCCVHMLDVGIAVHIYAYGECCKIHAKSLHERHYNGVHMLDGKIVRLPVSMARLSFSLVSVADMTSW
jgi:hypothetical protein